MARFPRWLRQLPRLYPLGLALLKTRQIPVKISIAVCLLCAPGTVGNSEGTVYSTRIGERQRVLLAEGSVLDLNADTIVLVNVSRNKRQVFLEKGEIRVTVRHDASSPMEVFVGHIALTDLGTQFDVAANEGTIVLSVTAGKVQVFEDQHFGSKLNPIVHGFHWARREPLLLSPGDVVRLEEHGDVVLVASKISSPIVASARSSWLQEAFNCSGQRLDEIVWQFNRYNKQRIIIDDPYIAGFELGGSYTYRLTDLPRFLSNLYKIKGWVPVRVEGDSSDPPKYLLRWPVASDKHPGTRPNP